MESLSPLPSLVFCWTLDSACALAIPSASLVDKPSNGLLAAANRTRCAGGGCFTPGAPWDAAWGGPHHRSPALGMLASVMLVRVVRSPGSVVPRSAHWVLTGVNI